MYKVIMVGTDGSETAAKAVGAAADIARSLGSELHIVSAFRPGSAAAGMAAAAGAPLVDTGVHHAMLEEAAKQVSEKAVETFGQGVNAHAHWIPGDAVDVILDTAVGVGADLIVVGSKGMRGARRYIGSVPNSVAHSAPCDVLVVKTA
jgi:nucleotide-binding universal stress UspA family protein